MIILAILFPFLSFLIRGRFSQALAALLMQATIVGWIPAAVWAMKSLQHTRWEKRRERLMWEAQHSPVNIYNA
jgi:uncharacterized membrane protein YqaE (UPF0057 family)